MPRKSLNVKELQVVADDIRVSVALALSINGRMNDRQVADLARTNNVTPDVIIQLSPPFSPGRTPSYEEVSLAQEALYGSVGLDVSQFSQIK